MEVHPLNATKAVRFSHDELVIPGEAKGKEPSELLLNQSIFATIWLQNPPPKKKFLSGLWVLYLATRCVISCGPGFKVTWFATWSKLDSQLFAWPLNFEKQKTENWTSKLYNKVSFVSTWLHDYHDWLLGFSSFAIFKAPTLWWVKLAPRVFVGSPDRLYTA